MVYGTGIKKHETGSQKRKNEAYSQKWISIISFGIINEKIMLTQYKRCELPQWADSMLTMARSGMVAGVSCGLIRMMTMVMCRFSGSVLAGLVLRMAGCGMTMGRFHSLLWIQFPFSLFVLFVSFGFIFLEFLR